MLALHALASVPLSAEFTENCGAILGVIFGQGLHRKIRPEVSHLYVQLKGLHGLLQHRGLLLLRQLDAVHPAPVQLLETVGAAHAGEVEEGKPLFAAQTKRFLGNLSQHLSP